MAGRYGKFNPKRRLAVEGRFSGADLAALAKAAVYEGHPHHKRNPGDYGLDPPARPRPDKTLCDDASVFRKEDALDYLRRGFMKGAVSGRPIDGSRWPPNVWAVTGDGIVLEAHGNRNGAYHGYPLQAEDPMAAEVKKFWNKK
ncbi:MAG: hypothetical protein GDA39_02155 [Hyphomonadaceae bacterium]|nr:hypothetical protein [Hyphomonadaceae bacterium]MBC6411777.1 hypothetical protein [Hyphomonadaceae bacterium]